MPQIPTEFWNQVGVVLEAIVAVVTATIVAFWVGLAIWTLRDIHARTRDVFAWILATLLVIVTGPVGVLLYMLLRPRETLAEVYDRQLEEEALLRDITARRACPTCQSVTEPEWLICPRCRTALRHSCEHCGRPLELDWNVCPFCAGEVIPAAPAAVQPEPSFRPAAAAAAGGLRFVQPVPANGLEPEEVAEGAAQQYGEPA